MPSLGPRRAVPPWGSSVSAVLSFFLFASTTSLTIAVCERPLCYAGFARSQIACWRRCYDNQFLLLFVHFGLLFVKQPTVSFFLIELIVDCFIDNYYV